MASSFSSADPGCNAYSGPSADPGCSTDSVAGANFGPSADPGCSTDSDAGANFGPSAGLRPSDRTATVRESDEGETPRPSKRMRKVSDWKKTKRKKLCNSGQAYETTSKEPASRKVTISVVLARSRLQYVMLACCQHLLLYSYRNTVNMINTALYTGSCKSSVSRPMRLCPSLL